MVHPTPALIPQLSFGLRSLPEHTWCSATKTFRALTSPVEQSIQYEGRWFGPSNSGNGNGNVATARPTPPPPPPPPQHPEQTTLSAFVYPLPPNVQRQKQINNLNPTPPVVKVSSVPAPTICWNDHLRML